MRNYTSSVTENTWLREIVHLSLGDWLQSTALLPAIFQTEKVIDQALLNDAILKKWSKVRRSLSSVE